MISGSVDGILVDRIVVDGIVVDEIVVDGIVDGNGVFLTLYTKRFKLTFVKTQFSSGR